MVDHIFDLPLFYDLLSMLYMFVVVFQYMVEDTDIVLFQRHKMHVYIFHCTYYYHTIYIPDHSCLYHLIKNTDIHPLFVSFDRYMQYNLLLRS